MEKKKVIYGKGFELYEMMKNEGIQKGGNDASVNKQISKIAKSNDSLEISKFTNRMKKKNKMVKAEREFSSYQLTLNRILSQEEKNLLEIEKRKKVIASFDSDSDEEEIQHEEVNQSTNQGN